MLERIVLINNMCIDVFTCLLEYSHESAQQRIPKKNMNEYGFFAKSNIKFVILFVNVNSLYIYPLLSPVFLSSLTNHKYNKSMVDVLSNT